MFWKLRWHRAESGEKTALCGGEGSYRGLGVEGGGAMLEGVWTVAVRIDGGSTWPHTPDWLDGAWSRLRGGRNLKHETCEMTFGVEIQSVVTWSEVITAMNDNLI